MTTIAATFAEALANSALTVAEALELAEADLAPETMIEQAVHTAGAEPFSVALAASQMLLQRA